MLCYVQYLHCGAITAGAKRGREIWYFERIRFDIFAVVFPAAIRFSAQV